MTPILKRSAVITFLIIAYLVLGFTQRELTQSPRDEFTELYFLNPDKMFPSVYNGFDLRFVIANRTNEPVFYVWETSQGSTKLQSGDVWLQSGDSVVVQPYIWNLLAGVLRVELNGMPQYLEAQLRGPTP